MAEYSHKRAIVVVNGRTITGWDNSADAFASAPSSDTGAFTHAFGNSVWVDSGDYSETITLKLLQHHPDNAFLQDIFNDQRNNLSADNAITLRYYDPVNLEEINATNGRISNQGSFARGNAHNSYNWVIMFPSVNRKLPT